MKQNVDDFWVFTCIKVVDKILLSGNCGKNGKN